MINFLIYLFFDSLFVVEPYRMRNIRVFPDEWRDILNQNLIMTLVNKGILLMLFLFVIKNKSSIKHK